MKSTWMEEQPADAAYVVDAMNAMLRVYRDSDPSSFFLSEQIRPEMCVNHLIDAFDVESVGQLSHCLGRMWGLDLTTRQWKKVLKPANTRTVGEVAEFIAGQVKRVKFKPADIAGVDCVASSAFLFVKEALVKAGVAPRKIAPSTPIGPYVGRYFHVFVDEFVKLAPTLYQDTHFVWHRVPRPPLIERLVERPGRFAIVVEAFFLAASLIDFKTACIGFSSVLGLITAAYLLGIGQAQHVFWREIHTFRDLAERIASLQGGSMASPAPA